MPLQRALLNKLVNLYGCIMTLKEKIHQHYYQIVIDRVAALQQVLADLKESGSNETKSTAGDKHETALAMLQIEQSNKRAQLQELLLQKAAVEKLNPAIKTLTVLNGSLVKTNKGYFFLSAALGKAVVDDQQVIAISAQSPLGEKLLGLQVGDHVVVNGNTFSIQLVA